MHVDQMRDELLVGSKSRMGAEMAVGREQSPRLGGTFEITSNIRKRSSTIHKPEQMLRQPESLAVSRLHPNLVRPQLRNNLLTIMIL